MGVGRASGALLAPQARASPAGMSPSANSEAASVAEERVAHAAAQRQFWQAMSTRIHQDQRNLRFVLPCTAVVACAAGLVGRAPLWAGATAVLGLGTWLMGQYFVRVRAHEYAYNLAEADRELARVQTIDGAASTNASAPSPAEVPTAH